MTVKVEASRIRQQHPSLIGIHEGILWAGAHDNFMSFVLLVFPNVPKIVPGFSI
jgi:hypothetical protein